MDTAHIEHLGTLRTEATHVRSGQRMITDAPVDNKGRGEAFSPTDLLATSLATCAITTMDIAATGRGIALKGLKAKVVKHMLADPRRVGKVEVHIEMDGEGLGPDLRELLEATAKGCPVARSLHPDLQQEFQFSYR